MGAALSIFGVSFGAYHGPQDLPKSVETPAGTVMIATLPLLLGIQLTLQSIVLDIHNVLRDALPRDTNSGEWGNGGND